jgi:hypothetical protein
LNGLEPALATAKKARPLASAVTKREEPKRDEQKRQEEDVTAADHKHEHGYRETNR